MLLKDRIGEADPKDPTMRCPPPALATGIAMAKIALLALGGADAEKLWGTSSLHVHRCFAVFPAHNDAFLTLRFAANRRLHVVRRST